MFLFTSDPAPATQKKLKITSPPVRPKKQKNSGKKSSSRHNVCKKLQPCPMTSWKRTLTKNAQRDLDLEVALRDVALKNEALTRMLIWVEAHLTNKTPHAEILDGLRQRATVPPAPLDARESPQ